MYEGLIGLFLNIPLSFFLIKYYGIIGAAYGNTISVVVSSFYLFFTSIKFFELHSFKFFGKYILKPMLIALVSSAFLYLFYYISNVNVYHVIGRVGSIIYLASTGLLFVFIYYVAVLKSNYLNERDRVVIAKIFYKFIPIKYFNLEFKDNK